MYRSIEFLVPEPTYSAPPEKALDPAVWQAWLAKGRAQNKRQNAVMLSVLKWAGVSGLVLGAGLFFRLQAAGPTGDLSQYRGFRLGSDLSTAAKQAEVDLSQVKVVHSRPALMQEFEWRPQARAASSHPEAAKTVIFSFYRGELYRIEVEYDRYKTEGMTAEDFIDAVSATYGTAAKPEASARVTKSYGDSEETLAQWQDPQYRFELVRQSYGPTFKLVGTSKRLEASAKAADLEAKRLGPGSAPKGCGPIGDRNRRRKSQVGEREACEQAAVSTVVPRRYMKMTNIGAAPVTFQEGDEVVLASGSYPGTEGTFVRLKKDVNWADIRERNGQIRSHPVIWLAPAAKVDRAPGR